MASCSSKSSRRRRLDIEAEWETSRMSPAQLERTKLLREITTNQLEAGRFKRKSSSFSTVRNLRPTSRPPNSRKAPAYTYDQLLAAAKVNNPEIAGAQDGREARIAGGPCQEGFLPGLQPSIHVAADRPHAIPRLLRGDARSPYSDLSWATPAARTSSSRSGSKSRKKRARSADPTNRLPASRAVLRRKNRQSCSRFTAKD